MKSNNDITNDARQGADILYLLAWQDAIERLDILILEIRHLQCAIISTLREPIFFKLLRFEEGQLWGNDWQKHLEHDPDLEFCSKVARKQILEYPSPAGLLDLSQNVLPETQELASAPRRK